MATYCKIIFKISKKCKQFNILIFSKKYFVKYKFGSLKLFQSRYLSQSSNPLMRYLEMKMLVFIGTWKLPRAISRKPFD